MVRTMLQQEGTGTLVAYPLAELLEDLDTLGIDPKTVIVKGTVQVHEEAAEDDGSTITLEVETPLARWREHVGENGLIKARWMTEDQPVAKGDDVYLRDRAGREVNARVHNVVDYRGVRRVPAKWIIECLPRWGTLR